jgi:hypothetical protein
VFFQDISPLRVLCDLCVSAVQLASGFDGGLLWHSG